MNLVNIHCIWVLNIQAYGTELITRTICPVEMSRFEVTGSSDLKVYHKQFKRYTEILSKTCFCHASFT